MKSAARRGSAAGDHALAFPLSGLAGERRDAGQACDLATREPAELRHIGQEGAGEVLLTPGKVISRSSFSRQTGEPRTMVSMSRSISGSSFSST